MMSAAQPTVADADESVVFEESFDDVANGDLPDGWTVAEGDWEVAGGELVGVSDSSGQLSRITFGPSLDHYRIDLTARFDSRINDARWAGTILDIAPDGAVPWDQAVFRSGSTADNGVEFARRTAQNTWQVDYKTSAPTEAGIGNDVAIAVEVQGTQAQWYWEGEQILESHVVQRSEGGVLGLIVSGAQVAFDDVVVTELDPPDDPQPGDVVFEESFDGVANGDLPDGFTVAEGAWEVVDGELVGTSTTSSQLSRIAFGPSLRNYRIDVDVRFESRINAARWAGAVLDIPADGSTPWSQAILRSGSTAPNGVEFAHRTAGNTWQVTHTTSAPWEAGIGNDVQMAVEVQGGHARWYWEGEEILRSESLARSADGVLGLVLSGSVVAFDDVVVTAMEPAGLMRRDDEPPYAVAHRGYSTIAPENTLVAAETAQRAGVRAMELDAIDTADEVPVMIHDATVDDTTDGTGAVKDLTLAQIKQLDAGSWFSPVYSGAEVPTWEETLDLLRGRGVEIYFEDKNVAVAPAMRSVVDRGMEDQVIYTSFSAQRVAEARAAAPGIRRGLITSTMHDDPVAVAQSLDLSVYVVNANAALADPQGVADLRDAGVAVTVWTVNDTARWQSLTDLGVDGIMTDRAAEYVGYRERVLQGSAPTVAVSTGADDAEYGRHENAPLLMSTSEADDVSATLAGEPITLDEPIDLLTRGLGTYDIEVTATGRGGQSTGSASFELVATPLGLRALIDAARGLTSPQRVQLHGFVDREQWQQLSDHAERVEREVDDADSTELLQLIASDALALA
jgi:glycerophosphoryl diester phosphodiesterase